MPSLSWDVYLTCAERPVDLVRAELLGASDTASGTDILFGDRVLTPTQWLHRLAPTPRAVAPRPAQFLAVRAALAQTSLEYFSALRDDPATWPVILDGLQACLRAGIDAEQLAQLARDYGTEREADLAGLLPAYLDTLHTEWQLDDPNEATLAGLRALRACAAHAPYRLRIELGRPPDPLALDIIEALAPYPHHVVEVIDHGEPSTAEVPDDNDVQHAIAIHSAPAPLMEARWVVAECRRIVASGTPASAVAIVATSSRILPALQRALTEFGWLNPIAATMPAAVATCLAPLCDDATWATAPRQATWTDWWAWAQRQIEPQLARIGGGADRHDVDRRPFVDGLRTSCGFAARPGQAGPCDRRAHRARQAVQAVWQTWAGAPSARTETPWSQAAWRGVLSRALAECTTTDSLAAVQRQLPITLALLPTWPDRHYEHIILVGATEADLPAITPPAFFARRPRDHLPRAAQRLQSAFPDVSLQYESARDALRRWHAAAAALTVTYSAFDAHGRPQSRSWWLTATAAEERPIPVLLPPYSQSTVILRAKPEGSPCRGEILSAGGGHGGFAQDDKQEGAHALRSLPSVTERVVRERQRIEDLQASDPPFLFRAPDTQAAIRARMASRSFSVSALEDFLECPFRFVARYVLEIAPLPPEEPEVHTTVLGHWFHAVMERLYRDHLPEVLRADPERMADDPVLLSVLDRLLTETATTLRHPTPPHPALQTLLRERLHTAALACLRVDRARWDRQQPHPLLPFRLEWRFEHTRTDADGHPVVLRGSVDRIDYAPERRAFVIVDYKTGKDQGVITAIEQDAHLQLPLYLDAVAHTLLPDDRTLGGLLSHVMRDAYHHGLIDREAALPLFGIPNAKRSRVTPERMTALIDHAMHTAMHAVARIRRAELPLVPHTCTFCEWKGLTRHE